MQWTLAIVLICVLVATVESFTSPAAFGVRLASSSKLYADVEIVFPNGKKGKAAAGSSLKDGMIFFCFSNTFSVLKSNSNYMIVFLCSQRAKRVDFPLIMDVRKENVVHVN